MFECGRCASVKSDGMIRGFRAPAILGPVDRGSESLVHSEDDGTIGGDVADRRSLEAEATVCVVCVMAAQSERALCEVEECDGLDIIIDRPRRTVYQKKDG